MIFSSRGFGLADPLFKTKEMKQTTIERNKVDANIYIDRVIAMLKDESEDNQYIAGYNGIVSLLQYAKESHAASLNRQGWTRVEDGLPETLGEDILIYYEMGGQTRIEIGYLCGERLIKGTTEIYPPVTHWMPLPNKPEPI